MDIQTGPKKCYSYFSVKFSTPIGIFSSRATFSNRSSRVGYPTSPVTEV